MAHLEKPSQKSAILSIIFFASKIRSFSKLFKCRSRQMSHKGKDIYERKALRIELMVFTYHFQKMRFRAYGVANKILDFRRSLFKIFAQSKSYYAELRMYLPSMFDKMITHAYA